MDTLKLILDYVVVPLIAWLYMIDKKQTIIESKIETMLDFKKDMKDDVKILFEKLDSIKSEIHTLTSNYVLKKDCIDCEK